MAPTYFGLSRYTPITDLAAVNNSPTTLGHTTLFTATATGSHIVYTWAFGDGATGSGPMASHTYGTAGSFTAVVTATNGWGSISAQTPVLITNRFYQVYLPVVMRSY